MTWRNTEGELVQPCAALAAVIASVTFVYQQLSVPAALCVCVFVSIC